MDKAKLNLSSLKDKVSNALNGKAEKKMNKDKNKSKKVKAQNSKAEKAAQSKSSQNATVNDDLRREALELGATEDDLKLVEKLEADDDLSEQEFDSDIKVDKSLTNEVSDFMKQIGLKTHTANEIVTDDEEEIPDLVDEKAEESEEEEEEEAEESEEEEDEQEEEAEEEQENEEEEEDDEEEDDEAGDNDQETEQLNEKPKSKNPDKVTNLQTVISERLSVQPRSDWYNTPVENSAPDRYMKQQDIDELYQKAKRLIEEENQIYDEEFNKSSSQKRFLAQILTGGTLSDKISALTLLVQEAPLHNLRALDNLFNMCQKKSRTAAMQCVDAVVDLLVNTILPPDRKLKAFKKQPLSMDLSNEQLILMYFEDHLKNHYFQFITMLEKMSHDSILYVRMKIVSHIFALLKAKPEQEANLLRLGVNKLGDIDNKVSSKTSYQILLVEQEHPAMKQIISEAVIDVVFRSNNDHHALYYSINTLNQTILTKHDETLANKLVDAYFALFEKLLVKTNDENNGKLKETEHQKDGRRKQKVKRGKKGGKSVKNVKDETDVVEEKNSKMFAAILTGLNRAFPFSNFPMNIFENHLNVLYKITHSLNFNTSVQALILIQTITSKFSDESHRDRYFRTLYESLWDDRLLTSSKQGIYLNLIFKSLKEDDKTNRVLAFVKRIAQICTSWLNIGTVAGMIYLLIQLEREIPEIRNLFLNTPMDDAINKKIEQEEASEKDIEDNANFRVYDSKKRDPQFANADKASLWEMDFFLKHYHPTVQTYAENFVKFDELTKAERKAINKPDLGLYSLAHFLDRFVYKKAKGKANLKGNSIMQPLGGAHTGNLLVRATGVESNDIPANTEDWLSKKANQIKPEDAFFYQYFINKQEKMMNSKMDKELDAKTKNADDDEDSELDEDTVWNALVASNPEVEGDGDDDNVDLDGELSDLDMSDFSDDSDEEATIPAELAEDIGEDSDSEEEGLVRIKTVDDLIESDGEGNEDDEDEDNEAERETAVTDNISSDGEDVNVLLEEDEDDVYGSDDEEEVEEPAKGSKKNAKRGHADSNDGKSKRMKFSSLPTFASAEDYAQYLESSDEE